MSLHSFFKMSKPAEGKKNFIYDCVNANTWFTDDVSPNDEFVIGKCGIRLWKRNTHPHSPIMTYTEPAHPCPVPLLKSHLQKAIRRKKTELALRTLYSLMQADTIATLRRIPIIAIEDVSLVRGLSTLVWLMMSNKKHHVTEVDYAFIENYIYTLCETDTCMDFTCEEKTEKINIEHALSHKNIVDQNPDEVDDILGMRYRIEYGGMKCDKQLLQNAIKQYMNLYVDTPCAADDTPCAADDTPCAADDTPCAADDMPCAADDISSVVTMKESNIDKNVARCHVILSLDPDQFIQEAIDFHPYPWIVKKIYSKINMGLKDKISYDIIKLYIWQVESSLNVRKNWSVSRSQHVAQDNLWKKIAVELRGLRSYIVYL